ncbi:MULTISPECIES: D-glycero-beta-D-manno-heptose 1-phosphate adenylyltransferase [Thermodesulfovibrio]|jgi:rfaE bifunctional protein nucleotidyltransferase chain/domain|uniref:D-glycero-beta-D-manno-heptose 1-phosphate adenylyltransferase n=1 Tax=Thermodesulfovibrio yellowstonii (strain ATCC 51303 / DSM 11347 / YP87) TaxID=289376 RepID=B5YI06_THEYD|nr:MULTISPECIES: D-glycero-beta-D-manno-heptose 1-phosphate adenylyltransferase [Thermodesulfovibrio]ACI21022.1 bifunctional protein HldE [Thermodesulfovibrio yellowstonii DSM 11347]MDI6864705.1 D-glycero-beta-D-manno-heptose 1-phosphate adenylyltransferase [Thermodesulfovibrio yellowstonii]
MGKIVHAMKLKNEIDNLKKQGNKIVFTNGCFDIIHVGHVRYLKEAKKLGDILVIGLNSDKSVKKIKPLRPINPENERAEVLSSLEMVDFVTFFDEETPYNLIKFLEPDVLVKGGDWKVENIVGAELVKEVHSLPYIEGISTTGIIERILKNYTTKNLSDEIIKKAKNIKFLILDVDGVLTSGGIILDNENNELKIFNVRDGHGLVMLHKSGINLAVITGRHSKALERRMKELGIAEVYQGTREKLKIFNEIVEKYNLKKEEIAAMGDDIIDLSILDRVGLSVCPQDAHEEVKKRVNYVTEQKAGQGAVRELCDIILKAKGLWDKFVDEYKNL